MQLTTLVSPAKREGKAKNSTQAVTAAAMRISRGIIRPRKRHEEDQKSKLANKGKPTQLSYMSEQTS